MSRSIRHLTFLCALLPQFVLALFAPAFFVCEEGDGNQSVELSVSSCCSGEGQAAGEADALVRSEEEQCGGCEDAVLAFSLQRDEADGPLVPVGLQVVEAPWQLAPLPRSQTVARASPALNGSLSALRTIRLRC